MGLDRTLVEFATKPDIVFLMAGKLLSQYLACLVGNVLLFVPAGLFALAGLFQMAVWAQAKHRAYKKDFASYPRGRKAILPFLL